MIIFQCVAVCTVHENGAASGFSANLRFGLNLGQTEAFIHSEIMSSCARLLLRLYPSFVDGSYSFSISKISFSNNFGWQATFSYQEGGVNLKQLLWSAEILPTTPALPRLDLKRLALRSVSPQIAGIMEEHSNKLSNMDFWMAFVFEYDELA
jgi:hypothetical protein